LQHFCAGYVEFNVSTRFALISILLDFIYIKFDRICHTAVEWPSHLEIKGNGEGNPLS
jgi:hypothetical protein